MLGPSSRGRINDGQTFNPLIDGDVAEGSFGLAIMLLALVMTIAVLIIVVALVMGVMYRRSQTKTERPVDCGPPTVAVPKQKRINKFLSGRSVIFQRVRANVDADAVASACPAHISTAMQQIVQCRIVRFRSPAACHKPRARWQAVR